MKINPSPIRQEALCKPYKWIPVKQWPIIGPLHLILIKNYKIYTLTVWNRMPYRFSVITLEGVTPYFS